ncbi:MAG: GtrA family protein [Alphaproteobacteria bacterium]
MIDIFKSHYKNLSKFTVVGAVNTVIDFSVFYFLYNIFGVYYVLAHIGAFFVALINSFYFNAIWTFKNLKKDELFKQVFVFLIIGLIGLGLSSLTIYTLGEWFFNNMYAAKIFAMFVSFVWNYIGSWVFVFKPKSD